MLRYKQKQTGFTIVELLIVIVVIGILAAITIVAYNGVQGRARDSSRQSGMNTIEKALGLYFVDNGGYPTCSNTVYQPGAAASGCDVTALTSSLVPKYISSLPKDPKNSGNDVYQYGFGWKKTGATSYVGDNSNNYITTMRLETVSGNINSGFVSPAYYNYLGGSNN